MLQAKSPMMPASASRALAQPIELKQQFALSAKSQQRIAKHRQEIIDILQGRDDRLLMIVGPCSIHDPEAVFEYAQKLQQQAEKHAKTVKIVMRTYIEKPRTTVGWKGFVYDPSLEQKEQQHLQHLSVGLAMSRELLVRIADLGLAMATEVLNPMLSPYFDDLYSWGAIGARTSESQIHREIASLLPYAIGFKNGTDGNVNIALDAIQAAGQAQQFLGTNELGQMVMHNSQGNPCSHLILRGSQKGTNYDQKQILAIQQNCQADTAIIVDCSHGNSQKIARNQIDVLKQVINEQPMTHIKGVMIESHLQHGKQSIQAQPLQYGCSITDECLGWDDTVQLIEYAVNALA